jgi:Phage portal protein
MEVLALTVPTVSRSRDLHTALIGALKVRHYTRQFNGERYEKIYLPNEPWMDQPDPNVTAPFFWTSLASDLFFHGRAFAYITSRRADDNRPASFTWLPAANIQTPDQVPGVQYFGPSKDIQFNGMALPTNDVVQLFSASAGVLYAGERQIMMSVYLDQAAERYAKLETIPGYLQQKGGETMSGDELGDLAAAWAAARKANAIGALNDYVEFVPFDNPSEVVADQRRYQALELARLCDTPAYLVSAPTEGASMTYQNAQQARQDLYLFGTRNLIDTLQSSFSMNAILPRNRYIEFDVEEYLGINETEVVVEPRSEERV